MNAHSDLDALTRPDALDGLEEWPVERVRAMRDNCRNAEVSLSYQRRLVQGRLDIVQAEAQRRTNGGDDGDADLVSSLARILADQPSGAPKSERAVGLIDPTDDDDDDELGQLMDLPDLSEDELTSLATSLQGREAQLSQQRRALLDNLDRLQDELVVRYREGRAEVGEVVDTSSDSN